MILCEIELALKGKQRWEHQYQTPIQNHDIYSTSLEVDLAKSLIEVKSDAYGTLRHIIQIVKH